jgi:hypothetical protein
VAQQSCSGQLEARILVDPKSKFYSIDPDPMCQVTFYLRNVD